MISMFSFLANQFSIPELLEAFKHNNVLFVYKIKQFFLQYT